MLGENTAALSQNIGEFLYKAQPHCAFLETMKTGFELELLFSLSVSFYHTAAMRSFL